MEHYNGDQHAHDNADNNFGAPGDLHAPATLLPAVLSHLGLHNEQNGQNGQIARPATLPETLADLHSPDWRRRVAAVRTLGKLNELDDLVELGNQTIVEYLLTVAQDEDGSVRAAALHALGTIGTSIAVERLVEALHDAEWHVRETAILALGKLPHQFPSDGFNVLLHDTDSAVREAARLAIQWRRQGDVQASPSLATPQSSQQVPHVPKVSRKPGATRATSRMQPQFMQPAPSQLQQLAHSTFISSQNHVSPNDTYVKRHTSSNIPGDSMQEQREQPGMQDPEYEYYAYQGDDTARQWEKVTSYRARKNYRPFWIAGGIGGVVCLIVAANMLLWGYFAHGAATSQANYAQATIVPTVIATPIPTFPSPQTVYIYPNHTGPVNAVAWSPSSKRIASASDDQTVQVWDALTGNNSLIFRGHRAPVETIAWSPNGQRIASGSVDGIIDVWNPANGEIFFSYNFASVAAIQHIGALQAFSGGHAPGAYTLAWSHDDSRIAAAMDSNIVQEFDADTGKPLFTYHGFNGKVNVMAWSPDGKYIITAGTTNTTTIWNATNGDSVYAYPGNDQGLVSSLAWSPDDRYIALGYFDGTLHVWHPFTNNILTLNSQPQNTTWVPVFSLTWSPDSSYIAATSMDGTIQVWNATTASLSTAFYSEQRDQPRSVAWSPDGTFIASGFIDGSVRVWKAPQS